jgi:hypothetical protein
MSLPIAFTSLDVSPKDGPKSATKNKKKYALLNTAFIVSVRNDTFRILPIRNILYRYAGYKMKNDTKARSSNPEKDLYHVIKVLNL